MLRDESWYKCIPQSPPWLLLALANTPSVTCTEMPKNVGGGTTGVVSESVEYRTHNSNAAAPVPTYRKPIFRPVIDFYLCQNDYTTVKNYPSYIFVGFPACSLNWAAPLQFGTQLRPIVLRGPHAPPPHRRAVNKLRSRSLRLRCVCRPCLLAL